MIHPVCLLDIRHLSAGPIMHKTRSAHHTLNGYKYQFDKSILVIACASNPTETISLEDLEDIDRSEELIQCKYLATQTYYPSTLRKPLVEFIKHFVRTTARTTKLKYRLFAHFRSPGRFATGPLSIEEALAVFGESHTASAISIDGGLQLPRKDFERFVTDHLVCELGADIDTQEQDAKRALTKRLACDSVETELLFYNNALARVIDIARQSEKAKKRTTADVFMRDINNRTTLFTHWIAKLRSGREQLSFLKDHLSTHSALRPSKRRAVVIGKDFISANGVGQIAPFIVDTATSDFALGHALQDAKPLSFILDCESDILRQIKEALLGRNFRFNDGYEHIQFNYRLFDEDPIINLVGRPNRKATSTVSHSSYLARVIGLATYEAHVDVLEEPDTTIVLSPVGLLRPTTGASTFQIVVPGIESIADATRLLKRES
jgi:hypothetical protein